MQPSFPGATDVPEIFSDVPEMPNLRKTGKSGSKAFAQGITSHRMESGRKIPFFPLRVSMDRDTSFELTPLYSNCSHFCVSFLLVLSFKIHPPHVRDVIVVDF